MKYHTLRRRTKQLATQYIKEYQNIYINVYKYILIYIHSETKMQDCFKFESVLQINYEVTYGHTFLNHCKFKFFNRHMSLTIDDFQLERFENVTCLGSFVNSENETWTDINSKPRKQSKDTQHTLKSSVLRSCPEIYKKLIRRMLTYV